MISKSKEYRHVSKMIYLSWLLLFVGALNVSISTINISWLAVRLNILLVSLIFLIKWFRISLSKIQMRVMALGFLLVIIQNIGLFGNFSTYAVTTMLLTGLICIYICFTIEIDYSRAITKTFYVMYYILLVGSLIDLYLNNGSMLKKFSIGANTMGGILVFLTYINIALRENHIAEIKNKFYFHLEYISLFLILPLLMFMRARTSVVTALLILVIFFLLSRFKTKKRKAIILFWVLIISSIISMYIYSQITTYSLYSELNNISVQLFEKNIDSSRPWLWSESLKAIGNNWLIGLGTGIIASDVISFEGSFHNQFLQLFMQNGLIGLSIFYGILFELWKPMARHLYDRTVRICAAAFIGIIIYNCFETTLLQNKIALGLIEWQLIAIGVSRARKLDSLIK